MQRKRASKAAVIVQGLQDFLKLVSEIRSSWSFARDDAGGPWYRGQQRKHWTLVPNIVRLGCSDLESEDEIREEFAIQAPALSKYETLPANNWDFYFLMQHYGAPTRLLDWTESPVIGLYFAVRDNPGHYDSAVWILDPYELNKRVVGKTEVFAPSVQGTNSKDTARVDPWLPERWSKKEIPDYPVAIFPTHIARRISSQKSCFTVHGKRETGFSHFAIGKNACLKKIVIPGQVVQDIRLDLRNYGIDDATIFPDLEGLGRSLITKYRDDKQASPHSGVFVRLKPSKLHKAGIGVFAIRRIPKNTKLFSDENEEVFWMPKTALPKNGPLRKLYDDFAIIKGDRYGCPTSFNRLTPAWFMNESKRPNTRCDDNYDFYTLRDIHTGEVLTVDYETFSDYPDRKQTYRHVMND